MNGAYACPNDGSPMSQLYWNGWDDIWNCPKGCVISIYILGCHMAGERPRSSLDDAC